jgi:hypothetical protein
MRLYTAACTVQGILVSLKASWFKHVYTNFSERKRYLSLRMWKNFQFERCLRIVARLA